MRIEQKPVGSTKQRWWRRRSAAIAVYCFAIAGYIAFRNFSSNGELDFDNTFQMILMFTVLGLLYVLFVYAQVMMATQTDKKEQQRREEAVTEMANSGPLLESITADAYIGSLVDKLTIHVYPTGFIIRGKTLQENMVHAEDISQISYQENGRDSGLEIKLKPFNKVDSPILLRGATLDSRYGTALTNLAGPFKVKWPQPT